LKRIGYWQDFRLLMLAEMFSGVPAVMPDFKAAAYLFFARRYPEALGKLFARLAADGKSLEEAAM